MINSCAGENHLSGSELIGQQKSNGHSDQVSRESQTQMPTGAKKAVNEADQERTIRSGRD
jgi:hypothetical protein